MEYTIKKTKCNTYVVFLNKEVKAEFTTKESAIKKLEKLMVERGD